MGCRTKGEQIFGVPPEAQPRAAGQMQVPVDANLPSVTHANTRFGHRWARAAQLSSPVRSCCYLTRMQKKTVPPCKPAVTRRKVRALLNSQDGTRNALCVARLARMCS